MSIDTKQPIKVRCEACERLCKVDNPITISQSVLLFEDIYNKRVELREKYGIQNGGFELLMRLTSKWIKEHAGSTIYGLSRDKSVGQCTGIGYTMNRLMAKGLVEVAGTGFRSARVFIPSEKVLSEIIIGR